MTEEQILKETIKAWENTNLNQMRYMPPKPHYGSLYKALVIKHLALQDTHIALLEECVKKLKA